MLIILRGSVGRRGRANGKQAEHPSGELTNERAACGVRLELKT